MDNPFLSHNINEICAICLHVHGFGGSSSLLTMLPVKEPIETYKALELISKFKYSADGPQNLCSNCFYKTTFLNDFQQMCNKAQWFYEDYLKYQNSVKMGIELMELNDNIDTFSQNSTEEEVDNFKQSKNSDSPNSGTDINISQVTVQVPKTSQNNLAKLGASIVYDSAEKNCNLSYSNNTDSDTGGFGADGTDLAKYNATEHQADKLCTNIIPFKCRICDELFPTAEILKRHRYKHKNKNRHMCPTCKASFMRVEELRKHINTVKECKQSDDVRMDLLRSLQCEICSVLCSTSYNLEQHMKIHRRTGPVTCDICNKKIVDEDMLKVHKKARHGKGMPIRKGALHKCKYCNKEFTNRSYLHNVHYRMHENDRQHVCLFCGKAFFEKSGLLKHEKIHRGEKDYKCEFCDMRFVSTSQCRMHQTVHSGIRAFSCKMCGKKFKRSTHLKTHMVTHSDERPHVCPICNRGFTQAHCLRSHLQTHAKNIESQKESN